MPLPPKDMSDCGFVATVMKRHAPVFYVAFVSACACKRLKTLDFDSTENMHLHSLHVSIYFHFQLPNTPQNHTHTHAHTVEFDYVALEHLFTH